MNLSLFRRSPDPEPTGGATTQTAEELAAQLAAEKAEKEKLAKQVKDQNAYITKLESQRQTVAQPTAATQTTTASVTQPTASQTAAEKYAINAATNEAIGKAEAAMKQKYGEEAFAAFKDDFVQIARANIKDPFNIPEGLMDKAARMAIGTAFDDETRRPKILGAYTKTTTQPAPQPAPVTKEVVVENPGAQKIGVMQPGDKQNLGTTATVTGTEPQNKLKGPHEFFKSVREKNK